MLTQTRTAARLAALLLATATATGLVACTSSETAGNGGADSSEALTTVTSPVAHTPAQGTGSLGLPCGEQEFLARFTTRQKLAQMLNVGVTGEADARRVIEQEQIGGFFVTSWADPSFLASGRVAAVAAESEVPVMVTIDEEGGRVSRAKHVIGASPSARELARTRSAEEVYEIARERGTALRGLGITVDFAPVVDVTDQPGNAVIGDRAFGATPDVVTEYAGAYARGLRDAGVLPVLKHFPGHGRATGDSHLEGVTTPPLPELLGHDLVPFRSLIGTGAAVMVGHLTVPGLTEPGTPASLSPATMNLLRTGVGYGAAPFDGLIFTDDLGSMRAVTDLFDITESVLRSLQAGADIALWISTDRVTDVLDRLESAVASGELPMSRVDSSVVRIGKAKGLIDC
ncbi:glycoside hydrolase family 3 N-terminal domain-containing protein [Lolliginicoccus suaedae]|uniref:glycoside hydrolase family 3 N-terminal domain-containing protein n=1 Tax=Lolliginicoccus suaedae TaxID=2605429 RepID=UPI0011ECDF8B|nr:glycoside hydrolase family 3 N-terminal domain-containing protein [Lolliginicoccus suaedae]